MQEGERRLLRALDNVKFRAPFAHGYNRSQMALAFH
jgi:hypothetical protein